MLSSVFSCLKPRWNLKYYIKAKWITSTFKMKRCDEITSENIANKYNNKTDWKAKGIYTYILFSLYFERYCRQFCHQNSISFEVTLLDCTRQAIISPVQQIHMYFVLIHVSMGHIWTTKWPLINSKCAVRTHVRCLKTNFYVPYRRQYPNRFEYIWKLTIVYVTNRAG